MLISADMVRKVARDGLIQKPKWAVALSSSHQSLSGPNLAANMCEQKKLQMFYPEGNLARQNTSPGM